LSAERKLEDREEGYRLDDELDVELSLMLTTAEPEKWRSPGVGPSSAPPPPKTSDLTIEPPPPTSSGPDRRRATRYPLTEHVVRSRVLDPSQTRWSPGRVRDMSTWGGLYVETKSPLPFRTDVRVDFILGTGHELVFFGRVVRKPDREGMAIQMRTDPASRAFLNAFIEEVLHPDCRRIPSLEVRPRGDKTGKGGEESLEAGWRSAAQNLGDSEAQQRFIELCLARGRIDFALDAYRRVKTVEENGDAVDAYLEQIGTILGFYATRVPEAAAAKPHRFKGAMAVMTIFTIGVGALWALLYAMQ